MTRLFAILAILVYALWENGWAHKSAMGAET